MIIVAALLIWLAGGPLLRSAVHVIVIAIATKLFNQRRCCERVLLNKAAAASIWRSPAVSSRRALRRHRTTTLRLTELRSLFPHSVARAEALLGS